MELGNTSGWFCIQIVAGVLTLAVLLLVGGADAATLTVNASGGADYMRIQDAINKSNNGDTILVYSGTYYETVDVSKQLILSGVDTGGGKPIVDVSRSDSPTGAITLSAGNSVLEGFIATGSAYYEFYYSAGIWVNSHNNQIRNNDVSNNPYGITLYYYSSNNTLSGNNVSNNGLGIALYVCSNNVLSGNNVLNNNHTGILLYSSSNNVLNGNDASNNNNNGISLYSSSNTLLTNNTMTGNRRNFGLESISGSKYYSDYDNQIDTTNLVNGKPIYYIKGAINTVYNSSTNAGTFYCINGINVTIQDMNLSTNGYGIVFWNTTRSRILNVDVSNNDNGISLWFSSDNILNGNNASINNITGISLSDSSNNTLSGNNVSINNYQGIYLYNSSNNTIYNNFFNNTNNSVIINSINTWNITKTPGTNITGGPYRGGNFYASPGGTGVSQICSDSDHDGICDSSYALDDNNSDYLPLAYKATTASPPTLTPVLTSPKPTSTVTPTLKTRPTPEEGVPGFEAIFAITGLLAVAYLLRGRG